MGIALNNAIDLIVEEEGGHVSGDEASSTAAEGERDYEEESSEKREHEDSAE